MPFIDSKISVKVSDEKKEVIKAKLGATMPLLSKSETYLMVGISDGYDLWMGGNRLEKGAYVAVSLFGNARPEAYEELGIPGSAVYVTYHPVSDWGWNGSNF